MAKLSPLKLKRLRIDDRIADAQGRPAKAFQRFINDLIHNIEEAYSDLLEAYDDIAIAQETGDVEAAKNAIALSYVNPGLILSAAPSPVDNSKARITIASHARFYSDGTSVSVLSGYIDLLDFNTTYFIYYDQAARTGGTVMYQELSGASGYIYAAQIGTAPHADRHSCGSITTPLNNTAGTTTGYGPKPQGA